MKIRLNCDMGESFGIYKIGDDKNIMPLIDMANLACGFHSSSAIIMDQSVKLANKYSKQIGAHPSYKDLEGFGRRSIKCTYNEIKTLILYQIGALDSFCKIYNDKISYVKPHGALYNDMMKDINIFKAILDAISSYDKSLKLMVLSNSSNKKYKELALNYGIDLIFEFFADRNYNDDGFLIPRDEENAVILDTKRVLNRVELLKNKKIVYSVNKKELKLEIDTICVHSDTLNALEYIKSINNILK